MKTPYRVTEADFVAATKLSAVLTRKRAGLIVLVLGAFAVLSLLSDPILKAGGLAGLASGSLTYLVIRFLFTPYNARRNYRKYPAMHQEQWIEVTAEGIAVGSAIGEGLVTWAHIIKWRESEAFVLVYVMPRLFYIVKKDLDGVDIENLRRELGNRLGAAEVAR